MRNQSLQPRAGSPESRTMEHVCVQTIVMGVLQKWMSHFASLGCNTERRPSAVPSRLPQATCTGSCLSSPHVGEHVRTSLPLRSVPSPFSLTSAFSRQTASRQRVSSTLPCPDAVAPGQRQAGMEQMESWQGLRCPCISSICSLLRTFACFI